MTLRILHNRAQLLQAADTMRQLRPATKPNDMCNLTAWRYRFVTVSDAEKIIGVGAYFPTASLIRGTFNYLADLVVDERHRSKGLGAKMLAEICKQHTACVLDSGLEKKDAHRFYSSFGFIHSKYVVRLNADTLDAINDLPQQETSLINGATHLEEQDKRLQRNIQDFIDKNTTFPSAYQANLQQFMANNPRHQLLIMRGISTSVVEGVLLFELQNRLSMGGNCLHVSDLIVKEGPEKIEKQNALLLALLQQAKDSNTREAHSSIKNVVIEMTDVEIKEHKITSQARAGERYAENAKSSFVKRDINSFFSVTAKHFIKSNSEADADPFHISSWHKKLNI